MNMTISKENYRLESRLVEIQNDVAEIKAKLDALVKNNMKPEDVKNIKLPPREGKLNTPSSTPYAIKPQANPESTITPPVVLPEGQTTAQAVAEVQEKVDQATLPNPLTPASTQSEESARAQAQKEAQRQRELGQVTSQTNTSPSPAGK